MASGAARKRGLRVYRLLGPGASGWPPGLRVPAGPGPRTSLRVAEGHPRHLDAHLARLQEGAQAMGAPVPWLLALGEPLVAWLRVQAPGDGALRMSLYPAEGLLSACLETLPVTPAPYRLRVLPHPLGDLRGSTLARHKGLTGPWPTAALRLAQARGAADALLCWPDATVAETALALLVLEHRGRLVVPPPGGRVASITEALDLPGWAAERQLGIVEAPIHLRDLAEGRLWCLNAVRGFWPAMLEPESPEGCPWAMPT